MWNSSGEKQILQGITVCLVSAVLSTMWWPGSFQTMSRGHILVFFNRHCSTLNLVKEKQGGLVPTGLKRWPLKLFKHFADATCVSPSPAGPRAAVLWTFSIWLIWSFEWGLQMGAAYSSLGRTKVLYAISFVLLSAKAKFLRRKPSV